MNLLTRKSDTIGALSSTLCLVHCLATPLLFVAHSLSHSSSGTAPVWWHYLDYFFLFISLLAIYRSSQTSIHTWVKWGFWLGWFSLTLLVVNEKMHWFKEVPGLIHLPAIALVVLHLYNRRSCRCQQDSCCVKR